MATIEERVKSIVAEVLSVDDSQIERTSSFRDDLDADSLDLVDLIMRFEEEFGGDISDEDAQTIQTVGDAVTYINTHLES